MPQITPGDLARRLGLPIRGNTAGSITGAAMLEDAGPHDLAFVGGPKYFDRGANSSAGCIIAIPDFSGRPDQTIVDSPQPRAHFAHALSMLYPPRTAQPGIHPSAQIDSTADVSPSAEIGAFATIAAGARIGQGTLVDVGCFIGADCEIGTNCVLHPRVSIYERVRIGDRCILHSGVVIGADGFGFELAGGAYRKLPQVGTVLIGSDVELGANTCIDRATLGATVIGDGTKLDNMVHIAHNCRIGNHVVIAAQTGLAGGVTIGDYAVVGGQVGIGDKARIESRAIVGSGAGILTSKVVRAGEPVWGTPARPLRQYLGQLALLSRLARKRPHS